MQSRGWTFKWRFGRYYALPHLDDLSIDKYVDAIELFSQYLETHIEIMDVLPTRMSIFEICDKYYPHPE